MNWRKKVLLLVLAIMVLFSSVSCGQSDKGTTAKSPGPESTAAEGSDKNAADTDNGDRGYDLNSVGQLPIAKETAPLSIMLVPDAFVEDYDTNTFTKYVEDACNIKLEIELLPASEPLDKLAVILSSGEKLTDVICVSLDDMTVTKHAKSGVFLPLNDYYKTLSANVVAVDQEYPEFEIMKGITSPDGNIYSVPSFVKGFHDEMKYKTWINQKWLDNLHLDMPVTTDEFRDVLRAFKKDDPNGNGIADEYPMTGSTGWSQDVTKFLMNAFTYEGDGDLFQVQDGVVTTSYLQPEWKEGLLYLNSLVEEGLIDPISFTQDDSQHRAMVDNSEIPIVGVFAFSSLTLMEVNTNPWLDDYEALLPLKGPKEVQLVSYAQAVPTHKWFITKDARDPELAFRVGDYFFDEDVFLRGRFGIEGEHWRYAKEGEIGKYQGMGFDAVYQQLQNIWAINQNHHWRNAQPIYTYKQAQGEVVDDDPHSYGMRIHQAVQEYYKYRPEQGTYIPKLSYTMEEVEQIGEIQSTLNTYVNECKVRFITGDMDIEKEWDSFQKELEHIGIQEFLKVAQTAYDRMYKK